MGGDVFRAEGVSDDEMFQSSPPYGGRRVFKSENPDWELVSIHAPVWGATVQPSGSALL